MPHDAFSSNEIAISFVTNGASKCRSHPASTFIRACFSGMFLGFGGALSTLIGGGTHGLGEENPALQKLLAGAAFPVGIMWVSELPS
jgi:formate/nitrite transporter FocA (FNT family)